MMNYNCKYKTPDGFDDLVMCGDGEALTGAKEDPLLLRFMLRALIRLRSCRRVCGESAADLI